MNFFELENVKIKFGENEVLKGLNLNIEKGKIFSIIGPNGCGKTTLLRIISRNLKPTEGKIFFQGSDINKLKTKEVAKKLAVLSQTHNCPGDITVRQLISYGRYVHKSFWKSNKQDDKDVVDWAIKRTGLWDFQNRKVAALSGGERQRAWIAMSIAQKPSVLLLDEPTTYLDICHQLELLELVKSLNEKEKITILMVIHDINQAVQYSDEVIVIKKGKVYTKGCPNSVVNSEMLRDVFNIEADISEDNVTKKPLIYPRKVVS